MSASRSAATTGRALAAVAIGAAAVAAVPSSAAAATPTNACDASALQLSLLGSSVLDPVRANPAFTPCATDSRGINDASLLGLARLSLLQAGTATVTAPPATATAPPLKTTTSSARVAGVNVGITGAIGDALRQGILSSSTVVNQINQGVAGGLSALTSGPLAGLLGSGPLAGLLGGVQVQGVNQAGVLTSVTGALPAALAAAVPDVLGVGLLESRATATCNAQGTAALAGTSRVADLSLLGTKLDVNGAAEKALSLDTANINLGKLLTVDDILKNIKVSTTGVLGTVLAGSQGGSKDISLFDLLNSKNAGVVGAVNNLVGGLGGGQTLGSIVKGLTDTLQPILNRIDIALPPGLLQATIKTNQQSPTGEDPLTQQALVLSVSVLGRPVLGGALATSRVGAGAPGCVQPPPPPVDVPKRVLPIAEEALKCTTRPAQLIDVYGTGGRTYVQGVAREQFVGRTAVIYAQGEGNKRVGTAKVRKNGLFATRVALPKRSIRDTNRARYYAVVSGNKTRALKFIRRMSTTSLTSNGRRVTFKGRVLGVRETRQKPIVIKQRVTCKSFKTVRTIMPDSKGRFTVTLDAPSELGAGVYRAQTQVIKHAGSSKLFRTYTLPRVVGLN